MTSIRIVRIFALALLTAASLPAEPALMTEVQGRRLPVASVGGKLVALDGDKPIALGPKPAVALEGDLVADAAFVRWSPAYGITSENKKDPESVTDRSYAGEVGLKHRFKEEAFADPGPLAQAWPEGTEDGDVAVFAWLVGSRPVQCKLQVVPSSKTNPVWNSAAEFDLSETERAGSGIVLLWRNGHFIKPLPRFKDPDVESALVGVITGDNAPLQRVFDANPNLLKKDRIGRELLKFAAEAGNKGALDYLLSKKVSPNDDGVALLWACGKGRYDCVERLLEAGARADLRKDDGPTPTHVALNAGHVGIAFLLLTKNVDPDRATAFHSSPLSVAVDKGYATLARRLYKQSNFSFSDEKDPKQLTRVLCTQASKGHTEMVKFLLEEGVSVKSVDKDLDPLATGATQGSAALAEVLLAAGAKPGWADSNGVSVLALAAKAGNVPYLKVLLSHGAAVNGTGKPDTSPAYFAVLGRSPEALSLLLANGASLAGNGGTSLLDLALLLGDRPTVSVLYQHGARLDTGSKAFERSLVSCVQIDDGALAKDLLATGWDPNTKVAKVWTLASLAKVFNAKQITALLPPDSPVAAPLVASSTELDSRLKLVDAPVLSDPRPVSEDFPEAVVVVSGLVNEEGRLEFPRLQEPGPLSLSIAALSAAEQFRFTPPTSKGKPCCARVQVPLNFPASTERLYDMTQVSVPPQPLNMVRPEYPRELRDWGKQGRVVLRIVVSKKGIPISVSAVESTHPSFVAAGIEAVRKWTFKPAVIDGKPVMATCFLPVIFSLQDD